MTTRKCNEAYMLELAHKLDAIEPAARAMLAALKATIGNPHAALAMGRVPSTGAIDNGVTLLDQAHAAIAQAEAAGIKP